MVVRWKSDLIKTKESLLPVCDKSHEQKNSTQRGGDWNFVELRQYLLQHVFDSIPYLAGVASINLDWRSHHDLIRQLKVVLQNKTSWDNILIYTLHEHFIKFLKDNELRMACQLKSAIFLSTLNGNYE